MGFFSMTLFKHPKTGGWYFRKVVPEQLRAAIGRREIRESLGTKDPHEAKRKYPEVAARIQALLNNAAAPLTLDYKQVVALARRWYSTKLSEDQREPGDDHGLGDLLDDLKTIGAPKKRRATVASFVEDSLAAANIIVDDDSRNRLPFFSAIAVKGCRSAPSPSCWRPIALEPRGAPHGALWRSKECWIEKSGQWVAADHPRRGIWPSAPAKQHSRVLRNLNAA